MKFVALQHFGQWSDLARLWTAEYPYWSIDVAFLSLFGCSFKNRLKGGFLLC